MSDTRFFRREGEPTLAYRHNPGPGPNQAPLIVFLPGYMSDMAGGKATAVFDWAVAHGHACLLLDYSGCGQSRGEFKDGTLSRWRSEVLALIDYVGGEEVLLIGSSMGGWLMLLVGLALGDRLKGMIGIAPAPDFTDWGFSNGQKATIASDGVWYEDNPYGPEPTPTWRGLFDDGVANEMLGGSIDIACPIRLLHGQNDADVPWKISLKMAAALRSEDVRVMLIKDGDHRLSREQDVELLLATVGELTLI